MKVWMQRLLMVTMAMGLWAVCLQAQSNGSITGTVTDKSGAVIPGATVTVINAAQGVTHTTATNSSGSYLVGGLPAGSYNVAVEAKGFNRNVTSGVTLRAGDNLRIDSSLTVGEVSHEVTVSGSSIGQVQTQSSEVAGTINSTEVKQLELNGRNFSQLITLVPGVTNQTGQDEGRVGIYGNVSYAVNGGRTEDNNWELDGANIMDNGSNSTLNVYPSVDAISHVKVITSNYGAQYGRNASGTVQAETKSGSNQWHGDAYEFLRNDALNSRSFFDGPRPPYKKNDYGYTVGGPVIKNKTFFFWSEEWRKEKNPVTYSNILVPSNSERQGDFSDICPAAGSAVTAPNLAAFPNCPKETVSGTQQYFPNNQVPVSATGQSLLSMFPAPTSGNTFSATPSEPTNWREELFRIDQNFSSSEQVYFRFIHDSWNTVVVPTLWTGSQFPTVATNFSGPGVDMVAHLTSTLSPTLVNEFVADYTTDHIALTNTGPGTTLPSGFSMGSLFNNGFEGKLPSVNINGNSIYNNGGMSIDTGDEPWFNANPTYHYRDMITQIVGTHNLYYGAEITAGQKNEQDNKNLQGTLTFSATSPVSTGNALADMFLGNIASYTQANIHPTYYDRYKIGGVFVQDDWHATSKLTLNLGLRLDLLGTYHEKYLNDYNFEPGAFDPAQAVQLGTVQGQSGALLPGIGNPFNGLVQCGKGGTTISCQNGKLMNWAPRIGFAYDPTGRGTTAIRAGYGIFYEHTNDNESTDNMRNPPLVSTPTVFNLTGYNQIGAGGSALAFPIGVGAIPTQTVWPYAQQWNLNVQHQFFGNTALTVAYVGSKGTHLTDITDMNQLQPVAAGQNPFQAGQPITSANCAAGYPVNGVAATGQALTNLQVACGVSAAPFRPFIGYNDINYIEHNANSTYNALQISARRDFGGLDLSMAYTWSHAIDNSSDRYDGSLLNSYNLAANKGSSNFDQTHVLNLSWVYNLPILQNRGLLGGWQWSGIMSAQTGTPFTVTNSVFGDSAGVANGSGTGSRPDLAGDPNGSPTNAPTPTGSPVGPLLYNPGAFVQPQGLTFGNEGRNILRNPGRLNFDMGLFKTFKITEHQDIQFRAEGFNIFNHTQWSGVNSGDGCYVTSTNACTGNFLRPSGAHLGRIMQLGLKYEF